MVQANNLYMRIYGVVLDNKSIGISSKNLKGRGMTAPGSWCSISSFSFTGARKVNMPAGKAQGIIDSGMEGFSACAITKKLDEFSEIILSRLIAPVLNPKKQPRDPYNMKYNIGGDTVTIIITNNAGEKLQILYILTLKSCHFRSYQLQGSNGLVPLERFEIAYSAITTEFWSWQPSKGDYKEGGKVSYNLSNNKALSYYHKK